MKDAETTPPRAAAKAYLVGGGIAALASAAYLIRDGGFAGPDIESLEDTPRFGGSLDGDSDARDGYVIRGGRMFTYEAYTCTFDLLSFIPSLNEPGATVKDEIHRFNITVEYSVRSAQIAVYGLLGIEKAVSPLYKGQFDPSVVFASAKALVS